MKHFSSYSHLPFYDDLSLIIPAILDIGVFPPLIPALLSFSIFFFLRDIPFKQSRGLLVTSFLESKLSPRDFVLNFRENGLGMRFEGFNLIVGVENDVYFISNSPSANIGGLAMNDDGGGTCYIQQLAPGMLYGVSNASLDSPWDKLEKGREMVNDVIRLHGCRGINNMGISPMMKVSREETAKKLIEKVMADETPRQPAVTGVSYQIERALAHIKVPMRQFMNPGTKKMDVYGTRTTMVYMMGWKVGGEDIVTGDDVTDFGDMEVWECDYDSKKKDKVSGATICKFGKEEHEVAITRKSEGARY